MGLVKDFAKQVKEHLIKAGDANELPLERLDIFDTEYTVLSTLPAEGDRKGKGAGFVVKCGPNNKFHIFLLVMCRVNKSHLYLYLDRELSNQPQNENQVGSLALHKRGNYLIVEDHNDFRGWSKQQKTELFNICTKLKFQTVSADKLVQIFEEKFPEEGMPWSEEIFKDFLRCALSYALVKAHFHPDNVSKVPNL